MAKIDLIAAIETSSRVGSVAIALGDKMVAETAFSAPLKHSAELFPAMCDLLDRCGREPGQIEHVYISGGPGSFTGLRIAAAFAKTMHLANGARIVSVDTLDVIASNVIKIADEGDCSLANPGLGEMAPERVAVIVDAERGQFFIAAYERSPSGGAWTQILPDCLMTASVFWIVVTIGVLGIGSAIPELYGRWKAKRDEEERARKERHEARRRKRHHKTGKHQPEEWEDPDRVHWEDRDRY